MPLKLRVAMLGLFTLAVVGLIGVLGAPPATAAPGGYQNTIRFYSAGINGYNYAAQAAGSGARLTFSLGWSDSYYQPFEPPRVELQRQIAGGAWSKIADATFAVGKPLLATPPAYKVPAKLASQLVRYRFVALESTTSAGYTWQPATSAIIKITYENQARYTGVRKAVYGFMAPYCPQAAVHVVQRLSGGEAAGTYHEGGYLIDVAKGLATYSRVDQRMVALHECAHQRQFLNWGATPEGWHRMEVAAGKVFSADKTPAGKPVTRTGVYTGTFKPIEHAADCAALSANPAGYLGYGGYCNPRELKAGHALLAGKRF